MPVDSQIPADAALLRRASRLSRGITATWWYTFAAVVFFEAVLLFLWIGALSVVQDSVAAVIAFGVGAVVWLAATVFQLFDYRHRVDGTLFARWRRIVLPLAAAAGFGILIGLVTGIWVGAALPLVQSIALLNWPAGVRLRVVLAGTLLLGALWFVDARTAFVEAPWADEPSWWVLGFYSTLLPCMSVTTLWWWDVLMTIDRARAAEARLAATQERLRVATDVHDLQGHHLQVIALQLELAERLMTRDPDAALAQLRASRASVDEARQGTRDLATRFRSVALQDELANAVDLLRAAGTAADVVVGADVDAAPADVLGPVIRETTTNALRHGGGAWARLELVRDGGAWRYEISNDAPAESSDVSGGAGLEGLARRAADAGGVLDVRREKQSFTVLVTIPVGVEANT